MKRYSSSNQPRGWRRGSFHQLATLPGIPEDDWCFGPDKWGHQLTSLGPKDGQDFKGSIDFYFDPSGLVMSVRCDVCGGRHEALSETKHFVRLLREDKPKEAAAELHSQVEAMASPALDEWFPEHEDCPDTPRKHETPSTVQDFLDVSLRAATKDIESGDAAGGYLTILDTQGRAFSLSIRDLPERKQDPDAKVREMSYRKACLRQMIRAREDDILAAVLMSEVWMTPAHNLGTDSYVPPSADPDRTEALSIMLATPTFARVGLAQIERNEGVVGKGPGRVGEMSWDPLRGPSLFTDGLFATRTLHEMTPEEREAALARPLGPGYSPN